MATVLVDMSRRNGSSGLALGAANASGLVPSTGLEPRVGTTVLVGVVEVTRPICPESTAIRA